MKHTSGIWTVRRWERNNMVDGFEYTVTDSRGHGIVTLCQKGNQGKAKANAKFIVRACNSHYKLLEACKQALADAEDNWHAASTYKALYEAIIRAEEE